MANIGAVSNAINVGDELLLRAEKSNFRLSPFKVVRKTGSEVIVKNGVSPSW